MTEETVESITDALTAVMAEAAESAPETEEAQEVSQQEASTETEDVLESATNEAELGTEEVEEDNDESAEPETVFQAPEHWSSDERTKFDSLPPEAQEVLLERDKAFQKGYQEKAQAISAITEAIKPWEQSLAQRGMTADQAIRALFAAQHQLDTNAVEGILQIAQNYGVVDQLKDKFAPATDDEDFTDPGIKALQQEIKELKGQIEQTTQGFQQQQVSAGQQKIDEFKNAVDGEGKPAHPYFDQLMPEITALIQTKGGTLDEAYQQLVWTVPEFRDSQQKTVVEKTDKEKAEKVKKAKKAARAVQTNGKTNPNESNEPLSLKDELAGAFAQHSS